MHISKVPNMFWWCTHILWRPSYELYLATVGHPVVQWCPGAMPFSNCNWASTEWDFSPLLPSTVLRLWEQLIYSPLLWNHFSNSQWGWRHGILSRKAQEYLGYFTSHTTLVTSMLCQVGRFQLLREGTLSLCKSLQSLYLLMTPEVAPNSWPVRTVLQWTWKRMLILNKVISVPLDYDKLIKW